MFSPPAFAVAVGFIVLAVILISELAARSDVSVVRNFASQQSVVLEKLRQLECHIASLACVDGDPLTGLKEAEGEF